MLPLSFVLGRSCILRPHCRTCRDHRLHRHRDGRVRAGHRHDAMVGKYTSEEGVAGLFGAYFIGFYRSRCVRRPRSVVYEKGAFVTMLQTFGAWCLL